MILGRKDMFVRNWGWVLGILLASVTLSGCVSRDVVYDCSKGNGPYSLLSKRFFTVWTPANHTPSLIVVDRGGTIYSFYGEFSPGKGMIDTGEGNLTSDETRLLLLAVGAYDDDNDYRTLGSRKATFAPDEWRQFCQNTSKRMASLAPFNGPGCGDDGPNKLVISTAQLEKTVESGCIPPEEMKEIWADLAAWVVPGSSAFPTVVLFERGS